MSKREMYTVALKAIPSDRFQRLGSQTWAQPNSETGRSEQRMGGRYPRRNLLNQWRIGLSGWLE